MRFRQIRPQAQRLRGIVPGLRFPRIERFIVMKNLRTGRSESRMREREIRIKRNRLLVELIRRFVILQQRIGIALNLIRPRISTSNASANMAVEFSGSIP